MFHLSSRNTTRSSMISIKADVIHCISSAFWKKSCFIFHFMNKNLCRFKATSQCVMTKLCSFVVSKSEHPPQVSYHHSVVQTCANLWNTVTSQAIKESRSHNFVRYAPVWETQAAKSHPPKAVDGTTINQNKCFPLSCTNLHQMVTIIILLFCYY